MKGAYSWTQLGVFLAHAKDSDTVTQHTCLLIDGLAQDVPHLSTHAQHSSCPSVASARLQHVGYVHS
eukprot:2539637-Amphidinium_carterae.1